jgi:hypothetical protein
LIEFCGNFFPALANPVSHALEFFGEATEPVGMVVLFGIQRLRCH